MKREAKNLFASISNFFFLPFYILVESEGFAVLASLVGIALLVTFSFLAGRRRNQDQGAFAIFFLPSSTSFLMFYKTQLCSAAVTAMTR